MGNREVLTQRFGRDLSGAQEIPATFFRIDSVKKRCTGLLRDSPDPTYNDPMPISARNKLRGKIEEIQLGDIMAHVVIRVGDNLIESAIARRSADELKLKKGDTVSAVVKATEVMIQKD